MASIRFMTLGLTSLVTSSRGWVEGSSMSARGHLNGAGPYTTAGTPLSRCVFWSAACGRAATGRGSTPKPVGRWLPSAGALLAAELALEGAVEEALEEALEEPLEESLEESLEETLEKAEPARLGTAELALDLCDFTELDLEEAAEVLVEALLGLLEAPEVLDATLCTGVAAGVKLRLLLFSLSPPSMEVDM